MRKLRQLSYWNHCPTISLGRQLSLLLSLSSDLFSSHVAVPSRLFRINRQKHLNQQKHRNQREHASRRNWLHFSHQFLTNQLQLLRPQPSAPQCLITIAEHMDTLTHLGVGAGVAAADEGQLQWPHRVNHQCVPLVHLER